MDSITVLIRGFLMLTFFAENAAMTSLHKPQFNESQTSPAAPRSGIFSQLRGGLVPTITRRAKLYCRTGFSLAVTANNTVKGVDETYCLQTWRCLFELQSYGKSLVRLKNIKSGTFIAINSKGKVFSTPSKTEETLFNQIQQSTSFETFSSIKYHGKGSEHKNWYLGIRKKAGIAKKASKTHRLHRSAQFVTIYQSN